MSSPAATPSQPQPKLGYKRLAAHLQLPLTPHVVDFDDELNDGHIDVPSSCGGSSTGVWLEDDWDSTPVPQTTEMKSVFEDWDDDDEYDCDIGGLDISYDEDGAQVIHIPFDSPFYEPTTPPRPFHYQPYSEGQRRQNTSNYPVTRFTDTRFEDAPTKEVRISTMMRPRPHSIQLHCNPLPAVPPADHRRSATPQSTILVLDTSFLNNVTTSVNLSTLTTSSWRSPLKSQPNRIIPWLPAIKREADVPCSAIAFSPTSDFMGEMHFMIRPIPSAVS